MGALYSLKPAAEVKRRILVVDDNLDAVHSMATLVKMMGHDVRFAINGFAALEIAREFRPDVILLDIALPDFTGCEIARQLKWEPDLNHTRFIAISALPAQQYKQAALDAGCEQFHSKPIAPAILEEILERPKPTAP